MGGGDDIQVYNPGSISLKDANPEAYTELQYLRDNRTAFDNNAMNFMDQGKYDTWKRDTFDRSDAAMANRYAAMGLAGSSIATGAAADANRRTGMAMDQNRLSQVESIARMDQSYDQGINSGIYGIQNQFAHQQDQMIQAQVAQQNAQNGMWGDIAKVGGTIGGALLAGPAGAIAGGAVAGAGANSLAPINTGSFYNGDGNGGYSVGGAYGNYGGGGYGYGNPGGYGYGGSY